MISNTSICVICVKTGLYNNINNLLLCHLCQKGYDTHILPIISICFDLCHGFLCQIRMTLLILLEKSFVSFVSPKGRDICDTRSHNIPPVNFRGGEYLTFWSAWYPSRQVGLGGQKKNGVPVFYLWEGLSWDRLPGFLLCLAGQGRA